MLRMEPDALPVINSPNSTIFKLNCTCNGQAHSHMHIAPKTSLVKTPDASVPCIGQDQAPLSRKHNAGHDYRPAQLPHVLHQAQGTGCFTKRRVQAAAAMPAVGLKPQATIKFHNEHHHCRRLQRTKDCHLEDAK